MILRVYILLLLVCAVVPQLLGSAGPGATETSPTAIKPDDGSEEEGSGGDMDGSGEGSGEEGDGSGIHAAPGDSDSGDGASEAPPAYEESTESQVDDILQKAGVDPNESMKELMNFMLTRNFSKLAMQGLLKSMRFEVPSDKQIAYRNAAIKMYRMYVRKQNLVNQVLDFYNIEQQNDRDRVSKMFMSRTNDAIISDMMTMANQDGDPTKIAQATAIAHQYGSGGDVAPTLAPVTEGPPVMPTEATVGDPTMPGGMS